MMLSWMICNKASITHEIIRPELTTRPMMIEVLFQIVNLINWILTMAMHSVIEASKEMTTTEQ